MVAKLRLVFSITIVFLSFSGVAQSTYWEKTELSTANKQISKQRLQVEKGKAFVLNKTLFTQALMSNKKSNVIYFPDEQGNQIPFRVEEIPLFSKTLAQKYPSIKSYKGTAIDRAGLQVRFSVSPKGVQSMFNKVGEEESLFMQQTKDDTYILYRRTEQSKSDLQFICKTMPTVMDYAQNLTAKLVDDQTLTTFRVAISASGEYTQFHGGTKADALAAINATLTRVNGVFERDLAISLQLIDNTDDVIYTDPENDPYTGSLSSQVQSTLTNVIGDLNYDIGHLFNQQENTLDGNSGFIGAVCKNGRKGSAYSTLSSPTGDAFDIDLVAHEMGHQFGANHSFSHISEGTNVQVEPASGTTIMGYAGITGNNNVASNSNDYFHYVSITQIRDYLRTVSCGQTQSIANVPPSLSPLQDYNIPKGTAFVLNGEATDPDTLDVLSYTWEQIDNGVVTQATFGPNNPAGANFRSLPPSILPRRYFPNLNRVLSGQLTQVLPSRGDAWETVSNIGRSLNFSLTVRDNALNGGQSVSDEMSITVINDAGPFAVTSLNTEESLVAGSIQVITWDVADTNIAPVAAETVSIYLSTNGGLTYPTILAENVLNDGSQRIIVPSIDTDSGRIMVKADGNVFFAVNGTDFSITPSEIVLDFNEVEFDVCKPQDLNVPFTYETYLGFNEESTFSTPSLPDGLNATFTPATATDTDTSVLLDFEGISTLAEGIYPIEIVASSATVTKNITLLLRVYDDTFELVNLVAPVDGLENASIDTELQWENQVGSTLYDIEISTNTNFTAIVETATVASNSYKPVLLDNNSQYFWRVRPKNDCGEGVFSAPFSFTTIQFNCTTKEATAGLPIAISSSGTPVISSKIIFYEDLPIADINVILDIEHTFLADLVITLTSPEGTEVTLVSSSCGEARNIIATFDDDAPSFVCSPEPGISGTVSPLGSLSSFNGESLLGEWILEVRDNAPSDGGKLNIFLLEVCVEGDFRPDNDQDGVFDDGDDLCLDTPLGQEVNASGCPVYRFPSENFTVRIDSETCSDNNDGSITIIPKLSLDYQATVSGNGVELVQNFSNTFNLANLASGTYSVCVVGTDGIITYEEYCVEVQITEPAPLNVTSKLALDGSQITFSLLGSSLYTITHNNEILMTNEPTVTLSLKKGLNTFKVTTNLACQGTYEEELVFSEQAIVFPNPVIDSINIYFGAEQEQVFLQVFSADGRLISSDTFVPQLNRIEFDCSAFSIGIYYIKYVGATAKGTLKIIKQ
ncbi:zinc-dependent metalloprotease family protein [Maribacter confluentis]|uniref:Zinc-dependent metalloprotease family protein n=1 Tax=Maribacter confluentis TaxID=1656093 RepID=A0ABT8RRL6_9FLAO|nr:zinc-dependent metalloprotease family protein [Maribacter confluentis]MDO1513268.1 zinc-dependent metalloprotease family protein [Maribacter confluentis]